MLRQKPANEQALGRLIDFLLDLRNKTSPTSSIINIGETEKMWSVSNRTFSDCIKLKIIIRSEIKPEKFLWQKGQVSTRILALQILDHRLKKTKKQIHVPIPDFAAIADTLQTIGERLTQLAVQNEKWLKRNKNEDIAVASDDLFRVDDQRLFIAGSIASGIYKEAFKYIQNPDDGAAIGSTSDFIISATDDLISKLLNK